MRDALEALLFAVPVSYICIFIITLSTEWLLSRINHLSKSKLISCGIVEGGFIFRVLDTGILGHQNIELLAWGMVFLMGAVLGGAVTVAAGC